MVQLFILLGVRTHVKEIPGTKLFISLNHLPIKFAIMEIFDISKQDEEKKIYSTGDILGGNIEN